MTLKLFPFQQEGAEWLAPRKSAYLADEMRLGKTPQAIEAVNLSMADAKVAVVCPAYLRINWLREVERWRWWPWEPAILSYERVSRDGLPPADVYLIDEAHYAKSPEAKRTKTLLGLDDNRLDAFHPMRRAAHVWPLSGTPGNPSEVWTWLRLFGATDMPWEDFTRRYCRTRQTEYGLQVMGVKRGMAGELKALLGPWFKRRTVDGVGLPKARWGMLSLACGVDSGGVQSTVVDPETDELPTIDEPIARLMRELGERKVQPLAELLRHELASGELPKVAIMAWHKNVLRALEERLAAFHPLRVDGEVSERGKVAAQDAFNAGPRHRVWLGQIKCMVGIDLAATCSDGVFAETSWNPDDNAQAAARLLGPKQTRSVMWRVAASEDPLDYALSRVNARKSETITTTWS